MPSTTMRTPTGGESGTVELDDAVFGIEPNVPVMHQVVTAQLAARREGSHSTKTRAEVRGGGAKPWRQKGTGRARQGSIRAPHWRGGGVAMGPRPRSYAQRTPKKMVRLALRSALSDRAAEGRVLVVDSWGWDTPSTKAAIGALDALGVSGRVMVVLQPTDEVAWKSFRNLTQVHVLAAGQLNAYDVLMADWVIFTTATLPGGGGAPAATSSAEQAPAQEPAAQKAAAKKPAAKKAAAKKATKKAASEQADEGESEGRGAEGGATPAAEAPTPAADAVGSGDEEDDMDPDLPNRAKPAPGAATKRIEPTERVKSPADKPDPRFQAAKEKVDREEELRAKQPKASGEPEAGRRDAEATGSDDAADDADGDDFSFNATGRGS